MPAHPSLEKSEGWGTHFIRKSRMGPPPYPRSEIRTWGTHRCCRIGVPGTRATCRFSIDNGTDSTYDLRSRRHLPLCSPSGSTKTESGNPQTTELERRPNTQSHDERRVCRRGKRKTMIRLGSRNRQLRRSLQVIALVAFLAFCVAATWQSQKRNWWPTERAAAGTIAGSSAGQTGPPAPRPVPDQPGVCPFPLRPHFVQ